MIQRIRGSDNPLVGILITHTHPNHIGGLQTFAAAFPAAIYASPDTLTDIRGDPVEAVARELSLERKEKR